MTSPPPRSDEASLVAALLAGEPGLSRNRHYDLLSSEVGRRARRRASFLRSIASDIELVRRSPGGAVVVERGTFARARVRVVIHHPQFTRRAYLTEDEVLLVARTFPLVGCVFDLTAAVE